MRYDDLVSWVLDGTRTSNRIRRRWVTGPVAILLASQLVTGCGARTELARPPPGYVVLFPSAADGGDDNNGQTLSLWHSRTGAVTTVGTYAFQQAAMSFDGRFIAVERCVSAQDPCYGTGAVLDVLAPDGTMMWSEPETTGQLSWGWLGALRPDGQRVLVGTIAQPPDYSANVCVLDRQGAPVPIRPEVSGDFLSEASYAPDGQTVVAVHLTTTGAQPAWAIETMRDDGTGTVVLAGPTPDDAGALREPSFSFDGTAVVYLQCDTHLCDVAVVDLASGKSRTVYQGTSSWPLYYAPHFTPDGKAIVIRDLDEYNVETLLRIDVATGEASILWQGQLTARPWFVNVSVAVDE